MRKCITSLNLSREPSTARASEGGIIQLQGQEEPFEGHPALLLLCGGRDEAVPRAGGGQQEDRQEVRAAGERGRGTAAGGAAAAPREEQPPVHDGRGGGDAGGLRVAGEGGFKVAKKIGLKGEISGVSRIRGYFEASRTSAHHPQILDY